MNLLDHLEGPADLRSMTPEQLRQVAEELREFLITSCSVTGGHIGAGLGVVELTIALHAAFETPRDQLVWDVGHQGYPHKVLTGRKDRMHTLRQEDDGPHHADALLVEKVKTSVVESPMFH